MNINVLKVKDIQDSPYNPRIALDKASREYNNIKQSIEEFGFVEPLVVNDVGTRCVGGHQRLQVLRDMGIEEVECVVIHEEDEVREKTLCIALNRIKGEWDMVKLAELLNDENISSLPTGFEDGEVDIEKILNEAGDSEQAVDKILEENDQGDDFVDTESVAKVQIGQYLFKLTEEEYNNMLASIRDNGIFDPNDIYRELIRRLATK